MYFLTFFIYFSFSEAKTVAAIEIGGTSASVAITNEIGKFLFKKKNIPTSAEVSGKDVIKNISDILKSANMPFEAIGVASFGPIDVVNGKILNSPKENFRQFPLVSELRKYFGDSIPIVFETDVNAPAYSEFCALNSRNASIKAVAYLTIGTGVGLGAFVDNRTLHGILHPEFGHINIAPYKNDSFEGTCPFHKNCLEGLISSAALAKRLNISQHEISNLKEDNAIWDLFSFYIAEAAVNAAYSYAIDTLVVGGGIITGDGRDFIFEKANKYCAEMINGYVTPPVIRRPIFNKDAGLVGAAACAFNSEIFSMFSKTEKVGEDDL